MPQLSTADGGQSRSASRTRAWLAVGAFAALVGVIRWRFPERPLEAVGPRALLDAGFALALTGLLLVIAFGLGRRVVRWLGLDGLTRLETLVYSLLIGLGVCAYGILALGLVGLFQVYAILAWMFVAAMAGAAEWGRALAAAPSILRSLPAAWRRLAFGMKLLVVVGGVLLALSALQALGPVWDYDGLMYHLQGPRLFLEARRIVLLPDVWQANGPFTIEMLYAFGVSLGSATFAKLVHLSFAVLLVLGTFALGRRYLGAAGGWWAAAALLGTPLLPVWASFAYADMAWASFELLALVALLRWRENGRPAWLAAAGIATGLALGSKYLALGGAAVYGLLVLWHSRRRGLRALLASAGLFGGVALLIAAPWYAKNWVLGGNPFYPLFFGGVGWTPERLAFHSEYHASFGLGQRWLDYLLLPINVYARFRYFGTFQPEIPSLLFPLTLFWLLVSRPRELRGLGTIALGRFALWAVGSQQSRFLLPLYPALSLMTAAVVIEMARRWRAPWRRVVPAGLVGGVLCATLFYAIAFAAMYWPLPVVVGQSSEDAYLREKVADYGASRFVVGHLPSDARVTLMWGGRGFYCDTRCWADADHSRWARYVEAAVSPDDLALRLRRDGVTHLLYPSRADMQFMLAHDPGGEFDSAWGFFRHNFRARYTQLIYSDKWTRIYELNSP